MISKIITREKIGELMSDVTMKLVLTKGSVSSLLATRQDKPDPTAPSPYPRTLPNPPIANA